MVWPRGYPREPPQLILHGEVLIVVPCCVAPMQSNGKQTITLLKPTYGPPAVPGHQKKFNWTYILPGIHLLVYLASMSAMVVPSLQPLGIISGFVMVADLPISLPAYALAWKHGVLAILWIAVVGTLWWYFLSRIAERVVALRAGWRAICRWGG